MSDIYVMQRANGDVFALDDHGRFRVPLFNSNSDASLARLRNFGMLLFKPVQLDAGLLKQLVPVGGAAEVDFWLVSRSTNQSQPWPARTTRTTCIALTVDLTLARPPQPGVRRHRGSGRPWK